MRQYLAVIVDAFALFALQQCCYAGANAVDSPPSQFVGISGCTSSEHKAVGSQIHDEPSCSPTEPTPLSFNEPDHAGTNPDVSERLVGLWSGSLPKWMCNLFASLLPFHGCEGQVRFHEDGTMTTRKMYLTDMEGERSETDGNLSGMTWEIGEEDGHVAEIFMRFRYQGIEGVEHYVLEFRRRGRTDVLVIYNMNRNAVAQLEKIGM